MSWPSGVKAKPPTLPPASRTRGILAIDRPEGELVDVVGHEPVPAGIEADSLFTAKR